MNAETLIIEIQKLPASEMSKVVDFVRGLDADHDVPALRENAVSYSADSQPLSPGEMPAVRYADEAAFQKAQEHVFTEYDELLRRLAQ